jgi:uncharacterized protein YndB with AHSA1/START domain
MTLEEHDGKTTFTATAVYDSIEHRDGVLQSGMSDGAAETFDRLGEYIEILKAGAAR